MRALNTQVTTYRGVSLNNEVTLFVTQKERSFLWFTEKVHNQVTSHISRFSLIFYSNFVSLMTFQNQNGYTVGPSWMYHRLQYLLMEAVRSKGNNKKTVIVFPLLYWVRKCWKKYLPFSHLQSIIPLFFLLHEVPVRENNVEFFWPRQFVKLSDMLDTLVQ